LQVELEKSTLLVLGAQERLGKAIQEAKSKARVDDSAESEEVSTPLPVRQKEEEKEEKTEERKEEKPESPVAEKEEVVIDTSMASEEDKREYEGNLEIAILPPVDYKQMATLERLLFQIPNIQLIGRGGTSNGTNWLQVEVGESVPLIMLLRQMSPVKQVVAYGRNIIVSMKTD
jgi:hypothetical protein